MIRLILLPLRQIFAQIENCLTPVQFDPALARGRIHIAAPEQFALVAIPGLLIRLHEKAPNLSVESQHLMDDHMAMLAAGEIDFVVNLDQPYPDGYTARRIYSTAPMVWFRKEHPLAKKNVIELADILAYPQITFRTHNITSNEFRSIGQAIAEAGMSIKVMLDTSHLLVAIDMLMKIDALMLAPDYLSRPLFLQGLITPRSIDHILAFDGLRINLSLLQHERTLNSPLHEWIAQIIVSVLTPTEC